MNVFILLLVPVLCVGFMYIWMRNELSKLGMEFPLLNSSFKIYAEFMYRADKDTSLKRKYNNVLVACILVSILYMGCILLFS